MKILTKEEMLNLLNLISYSDKYEIDIQFWPDQTTVYIEKDGIELQSYGGDFDYSINESIKYLKRINQKRV